MDKTAETKQYIQTQEQAYEPTQSVNGPLNPVFYTQYLE